MRCSFAMVALAAAAALGTAHGSYTLDLARLAKQFGLADALRVPAGGSRSVSDMVGRLATQVKAKLGPLAGSGPPPDIPGNFYGFIPNYEGALKLPGVIPSYGAGVPKPAPSAVVNISDSRCFQSVAMTAHADGKDPASGAPQFLVSVVAHGMKEASCDEIFLVGSANSFQLMVLDSAGPSNVTYVHADAPPGASEWAARNGLRVFRFYGSVLDTIGQILDTAALFIPSITNGPQLDAESMKLNRQLLKQYVNLDTLDRDPEHLLTGINPDDIQSGDMLAIHRADGLGTFEELGTGEATSHIAMAMRLGEYNELHVVESTDKTAFWPNPNIQSTLWDEWVKLALDCNYTVALLQLKPELRAPGVWNQSAVEDYLAGTMGLPYGYHNFLWGFQDVPGGNLPRPLDYHVLEVIFRLIEDISPETAQSFILYSMNFRLSGGKSPLGIDTLTGVYNEAAKQGVTFGELYSQPELDAWRYPDGPSMVCDVYACSIYKVAGLFRHAGLSDDEVNCVEFSNSDAYTLGFFQDGTDRPDVCKAADPDFPYCFVMGSYTIDLKGFNSVTPYPHMAEHCSAQWPNWARPPKC